ncbi:HCLS1-binding protein 3-like [Asterias rubens]|uniref:HCLS1-binding protein 3-like n=1 Tax=Asterias rubens TaxID=7604 RepID=UPI00145569A3|nr:HCLS1-binding protein 3-like [Asterias rubens]
MTAAIATSRELKNKETGLDISVPEYREVSGLLTKYEEYHVIVITRLSHFKTNRNKTDDTVQFMVTKKYGDFEALHKTLTERFPATIFPDMPRKLFMMKDSTPQQRRACFDSIMRFIASNTKVCSCAPVLQFLGVNPDKVNELENDQDSTQTDEADSKSAASSSTWKRSTVSSSGSQQSSLFSDEVEDEFDFFKETSGGPGNSNELLDEDDLFSTNPNTASSLADKKGDFKNLRWKYG